MWTVAKDDFVPKAYMKWLKDTQDNVPSDFTSNAAAKEYCRLKLREELAVDFDDIFSSWEDEPIGVASIGNIFLHIQYVHQCFL